LFKHFDVDDSDEITRDNIVVSIQKSGRCVTEDDIQTIFDEHDIEQTGRISFDEFKIMLKHLLVDS
jgi:Ca2+-binding EF-hand superfamily protein